MLLGMSWKGKVYVDATLPFGLRSAPKIFTAVVDACEWILWQWGLHQVRHYLDDFIVVGPPKCLRCWEELSIVCRTCEELGLPLAAEKQVGPATCLDFLGIELDTWRGRKSC